MRSLILGNSGAGKTTLARRLCANTSAQWLSMDAVAFEAGAVRLPLADSVAAARAFMQQHAHWVIEGCYADIAEALLPECERLIFLNPGVDACIAHCRQRPWEPDKFASAQAQDEHLAALIEWVEAYPYRDDAYGLARHRAIFEQFTGDKRELTQVSDYEGL